MARLPDATDQVPVRRMSVARGTLALSPATCAMLHGEGADLLASARVAATLAAKDSWRLVPTALPAHLTDAFCDLAVEDAQVVCTMTVQAYARTTLESAALAGVSASLLALLDAVRASEQAADGGFPSARITGIEVVQNVVA